MTAKKLFSAILFLFILLTAFTACSGGSELCRVEGEDHTYVLFGSPNAITRISVIDRERGAEIASIETEYRVNEPWLSDDKENYGFTLRDIDGDGDEDFTVLKNRTPGEEKYLFYMNKDGEFKLESKLSGVTAPIFGEGTVSYKVESRIDEPTYANEPPMYELRVDEYIYGWTEHGRLEVRAMNRFSYFSETDIYCYAVYLPDEEGELEVDSQKWIYPEKLADYGLEPLE